MDIVGIITFVSFVLYKIWLYFFQKCVKCGGRFKMDGHKDSMGMNLSKNVTISIWSGPRKYTETWKCSECGHSETKSGWALSENI